MPGGGSSSFDLDFLPVPVNVGGTVVPAGTLLAANGGNELHAINKDTGAVLATRTMSGIGGTVGMTYHAGRNSVFVVNFSSDMITEVNPETGVPINPGTGINTFSVRPPGAPLFSGVGFDVFFGDLDVDEATGNLLVVGTSQNAIRELSPTGVFIRDIDVTGLASSMGGIAIDNANREAWVANIGGPITRIALPVSVAGGAILNDDTAQISISPANNAQAEGNSGNKFFDYTVSISQATETPITVRVDTADVTASIFDSDYVQISNQILTFNPGGGLSQTVSVSVIGDTKIENNETFQVNLSNPTGPAALGTASAIGTIQNDDVPSLSINNVSQTEGDSGTKTYTFTVTLSSAAAANVTVDVNTLPDSATAADNDYVTVSQTLTYTPGQLTKTFDVTVNGDTKVENDERFFVRLSNPSVNAQISPNPTSLGSFNAGFPGSEVGIGFDPVSGNVFIAESGDTIHEVRPNGLEVLPTFAIPGNDFTDEVDLDFLPMAVNVGGTMVPAGTLLVVNGDDSPDQLYALNKDTGAILAQVGITAVNSIGGTYHAVRNRIFVANFSTGVITEVTPANGATFNSFPVRPAGSPPSPSVLATWRCIRYPATCSRWAVARASSAS